MTNIGFTSEHLAEIAVAGIREKKGEQITKLDMRGIDGSVCDFFIICQADNPRQVQSIADGMEDFVFDNTKQWPLHKEGHDNAEWILLDYVDVVVHVFLDEKRDFYALERLWADAPRTDYEEE